MAVRRPQINEANQAQPLAWAPRPQGPSDESFAAGVQRFAWHHWRAIDYHLYLIAVEKNRDHPSRTRKNHLLTPRGFEQIYLEDFLCPSSAFNQVPVWTKPILTFVSLPVLHAQCKPSQRKLVLGFDFKKRHLIGSFFEAAPDDLAEMGEMWEDGETVIDIRVERFLEILGYSMENEMEVFGRGLFHHFHETKRQFSVGLDLVVVIEFLQFLDDFANFLWDDGADFRNSYKQYEDSLRDALCQASLGAWFALRDGRTIQQFCHRQMQDAIRSGVFLDQIEAPSSLSHPSPRPDARLAMALHHLAGPRDYMISVGQIRERLDLLMLMGTVHLFAMFGRLIQCRD
ncbi:hypothetical protein N7492_010135 [Penicillium capsulatum]|uniref:Uncharacterized protein n=1 Tax=Penicillium capsulatum TaxID=69766 RepID=A0A9W9HND9_9EURO|nr:hypothetical protein N7492_010135 [Penicillium capsulatum]KAJ6112643.1 hypothetical protein N7512_007967 [Penicillium capsulatum]